MRQAPRVSKSVQDHLNMINAHAARQCANNASLFAKRVLKLRCPRSINTWRGDGIGTPARTLLSILLSAATVGPAQRAADGLG